jgi:lysozyme
MTPHDRDRLRAQLQRHEAFRGKPYVDTVGKLTIGYGRNLDDVGISESEGDFLLENDIDVRVRALVVRYPSWFPALDPIRQAVLVNMAFMGLARLAGFVKMISAVSGGDYETAADEMLASKWAQQTGHRAGELAAQMRSGAWQC